MNQAWITTIIRLDARTFAAKQRVANQQNVLPTIAAGALVIFWELVLALVSLPLYFFLSTKDLQQRGASAGEIHSYQLRRKITLLVLATFILGWFIKIFISAFVISRLLPTSSASASTLAWRFERATDYAYDASKVQIVDGVLLFKASELPVATPTALPSLEPAPEVTVEATPTIIAPEATLEPAPTLEATPVPVEEPSVEPVPTEAPKLLFWGVNSVHAQTNTCSTTVRPLYSLEVNNLEQWTGFTQSAVNTGGTISYQLSIDNATSWVFWNGSQWAPAGEGNSNSAEEINVHITSLSTTTGQIMFKAILTSDCVTDMTMLGVSVGYEVIAPSPTATPPLSDLVSTVESPLPSTLVAPALDPSVGEIVYSNGLATGWLHPSYALTNAVSDITNTEKTFSERATFKLSAQNAGVAAFLKTFSTSGYDALEFYIAGDTGADFAVSANVLDTVINPVRIRDYITRDVDGSFQKVSIPLSALGAENKTIINVAFTNLLNTSSTIWIGDVVFVRGDAIPSPEPSPSIEASPTPLVETTPEVTVSPLPTPTITTEPEIIPTPSATPTPSLEEINYQALLDQNTAPELTIISAEQQEGGDVLITYTLTDAESNIVSLDRYEYSLTGQFTGEQQPLTGNLTHSLHDGVFTLDSSTSGTPHHFVWRVSSDAPSIQDASVYVRLRPADSLVSGESTVSAPFAIDTQGPEVLITSVIQQTDSDTVRIGYTLSATTVSSVAIEISDDNGVTWTVPTTSVTGGVGESIGSGQRVITWNAGIDYANQENSTMRVRLVATDTLGNTAISAFATPFSVDTKTPFGASDLRAATSTTTSITWAWTPVSVEANFDYYELWYGTNQAAVENQNGGALRWSVTRDADLAEAGTSATVTTGLAPNTTYFAQLVAVDSFGHTTTLSSASGTTGQIPELPIAPILDQPTPTTTNTAITLTGTAILGSTINLFVDGALVEEDWATAGFLGQFSGTVDLTIGSHTVTVTATNNDETSDSSSSVVIEVIAPTISPAPTPDVRIPEDTVPDIVPTPALPALPIDETDEQTRPTSSPSGIDTFIAAVTGLGGGETALPLSPSNADTAQIVKDLNRSRESKLLPPPAVASVAQAPLRNGVAFSGQGVPNSDIVLFIFSDQAVMYHTKVAPDGNWRHEHDQNFVELKPGIHEVYAMTLEPGAGVRSASSFVKSFEVKRDVRSLLAQIIDIPTTLLTLVIVGLSIWWFRARQSSTSSLRV